MNKYLVLNEQGEFKVITDSDYDSTYDLLSKNVEGFIEHVTYDSILDKRKIDMWINDEGKLIDKLPTVLFVDENDKAIEVLNGNIVFAKYDDCGNTLPLSDEEINFIIQHLSERIAYVFFTNPFTGKRLENYVRVLKV